MARTKQEPVEFRSRPAITPEDRENQMIALAVDLAEKQLRDGSASSQVITHYLKLGSTKEKLEKEILQEQKKLITAKTENIYVAQETKELLQEAMACLREYRGETDDPADTKIF